MGRDIFSLFFQYNLCQLQFTLEFCQHTFRENPLRGFLGKEKSICRRFSLSSKGSDLSGGNVDSTWSSRSMAIPSTTNMFIILRGAVKRDLRKKLGFRTNGRFFLHSRISFAKVTNFFFYSIWRSPHPTPSQLQWHQFGQFCKSSISPRDAHHSVASGPLFPQRRLLIDK